MDSVDGAGVEAWARREAVGLEEVVCRLREEPPDSPGPGAWLGRLSLCAESLRPYLHFRRHRYTRNLVYRDARQEVLLLCWDSGCASPIHGHAGQRCWLRVLSGALVLEDFALLRGGQRPGPALLGPARSRGPVGPGAVDFRPPDDSIHRVRVVDGPAVTLHVYRRPIEECLVFDAARQRCETRRLRYDSVFGCPVEAPRP